MASQQLTKEDLQQFRMELLHDFKRLLEPRKEKEFKPWLKNADVKKLLNISSNTVQRLRITGKLKSSKIGGIHYYRYEDIDKLIKGASL